MTEEGTALRGVRVVEVATGVSLVGAGLAANLPGALCRDFGAEVTRIETSPRPSLDTSVEWSRAWNRDKQVVEVAVTGLAAAIDRVAGDADIIFLAGPEESLERQGVGYENLARLNPRLIVSRIRPSYNASGPLSDFELLVHARSGLLSQFRGHRPGPVFCDLSIGSAGAALAATVGALACLYERETTGVGGWVETSMYDGMLAILPMIIGRAERPSPALESKWARADPTPPLSFRCADGEYVQLWMGAKGAYEAFLEHIGDPPSEAGYAADMRSGAIIERSEQWARRFATADRARWLMDLADRDFRCEPVLRPGQALVEDHLATIGLSVEHHDDERGTITVLGPVGQVTPRPGSVGRHDRPPSEPSARLLAGIRILDLSAYLAGPVTASVLSELGADVVKVEPTTGDAHRWVEAMFAAGQRGKRAIALDLKSSAAADVLHRLFEWSDVVHHNSRLGLAEKLGYDEDPVRHSNPNVIYCHASGFGSHGQWSPRPANDHLMQALCGTEAAGGGAGRGPTYLDWGAIDVASGWIAACGILVGLYARRRTGMGQSVATTLLGAGLTLKSGAFVARDAVVEGPILDGQQTGYGAAYRIYRAQDGAWLALVVPDSASWSRLRDAVGAGALPADPPPLRTAIGERQPAEEILEGVFEAKPADEWVALLADAGVPAAVVLDIDRAEFVARILDDTVNRQLGRVTTFEWGDHGRVEQAAFPARFGPRRRPSPPVMIPALGQHTTEILVALGFNEEELSGLAAAGVCVGPA